MARPDRKRLVRGDLTGLVNVSGLGAVCPGQDGVPRALVLIKATALMCRFLNQAVRVPVQPSGHLAVTTRRFGNCRSRRAGIQSYLHRRGPISLILAL